MTRHKLLALAPVLLTLAAAGVGSAQTPANVLVLSGNGQMICQFCRGSQTYFFRPLVIEVTDASGNPIPGAAVDWSIISGGTFGQLLTVSSATSADGTAQASFVPTGSAFGAGIPFSQTAITASSGNASATFYLTQAWPDSTENNIVSVSTTVPYNFSISGPVGTTATPIPVTVSTVTGFAVPHVAVNLWNNQCGSSTLSLPGVSTAACPSTAAVGPTAVCAAGAGAGVGTVLTDSLGQATCNPILGGVPGTSGSFWVLAGGALVTDPTLTASQSALGDYGGFGAFNIAVTASTPTALQITGGNGQSAQAGQSLGQQLAVKLLASGGAGIAGQTINWTVSPAAAGTLGSATSTTDTNGQATNTLKLSSLASGTVTVTASAASASNITASFTVTAIPVITATGLSMISGNNQTVIQGATSAALTVQLNGSANGVAQPIPSAPVTWTINGSGTLSATSGTTSSTGQASVTYTAPSSVTAPATVKVTATAAGFSQIFTLTVTPPGPQLTANSFVNGADFQAGSLSPCSVATVMAVGVAPGIQGMVWGANSLGYPQFSVAGESLTVGGGQAPIYNLGTNAATGQQQLTFQVPCELTPGTNVPVTINTVGGGKGTINIAILPASPGIFQITLEDGVNRAMVFRPDGTLVSPTNPARLGETELTFATGLGPSFPQVATDALPATGTSSTPTDTVVVGMAGQGIPSGQIHLTPDMVGVWQVPFTIPANLALSNYPVCGNARCVTFSISVIPPAAGSSPISSGTTTIPIFAGGGTQ